MKKMLWLLEQLFAGRLARQTEQHLVEIARGPAQSARENAAAVLRRMERTAGPHVLLGQTDWHQHVSLPLEFLVQSHGILTGGSGSGKTMAALLILDAILAANTPRYSFGLLDPKTECFVRCLYLIAQRMKQLPPAEAERLRERIVIIDLGQGDPVVTPYNIAQPWAGSDLDFFATSRIETLQELLGSDGLSLRGGAIVKHALKLLAECGLPFSYIERLLSDERLRSKLLARTKNEELNFYFRKHFPDESKATLAAVRTRLSSSLLGSESIRLALSGQTVPDFRRLQDEGKIVLINLSSPNIPRTTARTLQALFLSDIRQSVFARRTNTPYLWLCDEAQNFFRTPQLRESMDELLRLARSFGSFFCFLTQNLHTAVRDGDLIENIHTNIRWSLSLRSTPRDAAFLQPALPVTGRLSKPRVNPYAPPEYYSLNEERQARLNALAHLPDRSGWLWLKAQTGEAIKLQTTSLTIPSGAAFNAAVERLRDDPGFGQRQSRGEYLAAIEQRDAAWLAEEEPEEKAKQLKQRFRARREAAQ